MRVQDTFRKLSNLNRISRHFSSKPKSESYDAIIVGGGHNGLVAAAYLSKSGLKYAEISKHSSKQFNFNLFLGLVFWKKGISLEVQL